ncbi:MAG TPA: CoB--CoM heterodisulfide reductase iron-sulfur subunit B family protein [Anaerolineaceae bacterium]|jgi:heterodisulfide reductase subunit B
MTKYLFYPGCSLEKNASAYTDSIMAIREPLDLEFEEVKDWNCCGATEYTSIHRLGSMALQGRNLALAAKQANGTHTLTAPCAACYLNLSKAEHYLRADDGLAKKVNLALAEGGLQYKPGTIDVRHTLDVIFNDVGLDKIRSKVVRPLKGLRVAAYYGCMIVRPDYDHRLGNPEYPTMLEELFQALGADVIDFPLKAHCCSGHMPQISTSVAYELMRRLLQGATEYHADLLATLCPMCQLNLDAYQADVNRLFGTQFHVPILYFSQLMGLAFGKDPSELGIGKEFVDARPALSRIGIESAPADVSSAPRPRKKDEGLPMPKMPARTITEAGSADQKEV